MKGRFPLPDSQVSVALIKLTVNYATLAMLCLIDAFRPCRSMPCISRNLACQTRRIEVCNCPAILAGASEGSERIMSFLSSVGAASRNLSQLSSVVPCGFGSALGSLELPLSRELCDCIESQEPPGGLLQYISYECVYIYIIYIYIYVYVYVYIYIYIYIYQYISRFNILHSSRSSIQALRVFTAPTNSSTKASFVGAWGCCLVSGHTPALSEPVTS